MRKKDKRLLTRLETVVAEHLSDEGLDVGMLAREMALSRTQLYRVFNRLVGKPPKVYLLHHRLEHARSLLRDGECETVTQVAARVGMKRSYFTRSYKTHFGVTPREDLGG